MQQFPHARARRRWLRWLAGSAAAAVGAGGAIWVNSSTAGTTAGTAYRSGLPLLGALPPLDGATGWLNSPPLDATHLRGKVVLVDFWTYSCINCIRTLPYLRAWAGKYREQGLVVIGVHTPEFSFEQDSANIGKAVARFKLDYPIAVDSEQRIWHAFRNNAWPVFYIADAQGQVRARLVGEGGYDKAERIIQSLLAEAGRRAAMDTLTAAPGSGELAAPDLPHLGSGETYIGYRQAANFVARGGVRADVAHAYAIGELRRNEWSLAGDWTVGAERATLNHAGGGIAYRFRARDLHLVLGAGGGAKPVRFQLTIDGQPPGGNHGSDTDAHGNGVITDTRLYQLVRQAGPVTEHTVEIRFLDHGVAAYAFTFG